MKIGVIGLGYIGSVTVAVLASQGNEVIGVDNVETRIGAFIKGNLPLYEPGLEELLGKCRKSIKFTSSYDELRDVQAAFIAVPTPNRDGRIDISYVLDAARSLSRVNPSCIAIIKSTVVPGTAKIISEDTRLRVVSNPEFTREGSAIQDTVSPDRLVIGGRDEDAVKIVNSIWSFTNAPTILTTNENAELIKYASNAFLATKISFINEFANLCELIPGADVETVAKGMGLDKRIGDKFLKAGIGYGGSCFPKDTLAIASFARDMGSSLKIIEAASSVNDKRISHAVSMIRKSLDVSLKEARVGILGVAFKDSTDDVRESQSLKLIQELIPISGRVNVYDPIVYIEIEGTSKCTSMDECIEVSDIVVVATEWPEFRKLPESAREKAVLDMRRILDSSEFERFTAVGYYNGKN